MQTIINKIVARVYGHGRGWAFSANDFLDLAGRGTIDKTLAILRDRGTIRQVCRGLYDYPRFSKTLRMQSPPDIDRVAQAMARKRGWRIQACGPWAANLLGLSTQVPARVVYLTDGKRTSIGIGNLSIEFRPTAIKDLDTGKCGLVIQALRGVGKDRIDAQTITYLRKHLSTRDCRKLLGMTSVTGWIYEAIKKLCRTGETADHG